MSEKIALKRLTRSDLTFFKSQHEKLKAGNQKSINLNAKVFIELFYPALPSISERMGNEIPVVIGIRGPGVRAEHRLTRKIIKGYGYKNWRLNGEFVLDPEGEIGRYSNLSEGDYALIVFHGDSFPRALDLVLVSVNEPTDRDLHGDLSHIAGSASMVAVEKEHLIQLSASASLMPDHPLRDLFLDQALEDAAFNGLDGTHSLLSRPSGSKLTQWQLLEARRRAEEIGRIGEEFVDSWLESRMAVKEIVKYGWASKENAVQPFDFWFIDLEGKRIELDVKSTRHDFDAPLHISMNELRQMAHSARYDIYRIYAVRGNEAEMRICEGASDLARRVLESISLPPEITPDGFSIKPSVLKFGPPLKVYLEPED